MINIGVNCEGVEVCIIVNFDFEMVFIVIVMMDLEIIVLGGIVEFIIMIENVNDFLMIFNQDFDGIIFDGLFVNGLINSIGDDVVLVNGDMGFNLLVGVVVFVNDEYVINILLIVFDFGMYNFVINMN